MIKVNNLCKTYGSHKAVDNISFTIEPGNVYGFLGPNGAGKSTTMNMITGCLAPTSGEVTIGDFDIYEDAVEAKKLIGYLPEIPPLYIDMTVTEYLTFVADVKKVPKSEVKAQLAYAMEKTQITDMAPRIIKHLSKGYKQRVGIAQALIGNPEVIILDEPTVGLDPSQIIEIRDLIRELGKDHTVILSSHILQEVKSVCNRIIIITKGHLVANDTLENLEDQAERSTIEILAKGNAEELASFVEGFDHIVSVVSAVQDAEHPEYAKISARFDGDSIEIRSALSKALTERGNSVAALDMNEVSLESIFLELTAKAKAEAEEKEAMIEAEILAETASAGNQDDGDITEEKEEN